MTATAIIDVDVDVDIDVDVAVLGGGPAGSALALNLAPFMRVLVLDKGRAAARRVGESLPAAAIRLLRDMHLAQDFLAQGHAPCHVTRSCWGADKVTEQDAARNLDGHGWHLDRDRFNDWLARIACARGAAHLRPCRLLGVRREAHPQARWLLDVERKGRILRVRAGFLVDASGREASLARQLGATRRADGKLVCGWLFGHDNGAANGSSELHAEADGWWYSSPLPGGRRLLAFYTDADLPAARAAHSSSALLARLDGVPQLRALLTALGFRSDGEHGFCATHGSALDQPWGDGWLAVGDAALAFDPLSSQGLFNALYSGLAGAEAVHRHLQRGADALEGYGAGLAQVRAAYAAHLDAWYRQEQRWPERLFWQRRHPSAAVQPASRTISGWDHSG